MSHSTPSKKNYSEKFYAHENYHIKRPNQLRSERSMSSSFFLLVNAQVYVNIDQGIY